MIALRISSLLVAFAVAALALLPLRFAWAAAAPRDLDVASIAGTVWSGELRNVRWQGLDLGNLDVASSLADRPGDLVMHISSKSGPLKSASIAASRGGSAIDELSGAVELSRIFPQAPAGAMLRLSDGKLATTRQACLSAEGRIATDEIPAQRAPALEGMISCDSGHLLLSLASADHARQLKIAADMSAAKPSLTVIQADAATTIWLATMGIAIKPTGQKQ